MRVGSPRLNAQPAQWRARMSTDGGRADSRRTKPHYSRLSCISWLSKMGLRKRVRKQIGHCEKAFAARELLRRAAP